MTARQVFEGLLTELSKVNAPSMLLQDFNYFFNKAINQYINKRYNIYDISQQTTDDLRILKATSILEATESIKKGALANVASLGAGSSKLFGATYEVNLPEDYLHILNCICIYKLDKDYKCYNRNDYVQFAAKRLTADTWSTLQNDFYNRPLPERPYYYIHNVNTQNQLPTNPLENDVNPNGTDMYGTYQVGNRKTLYYLTKPCTTPTNLPAGTEVYVKGSTVFKNSNYTEKLGVDVNTLSTRTVEGKSDISNFPRTIYIGGEATDCVERKTAQRYGNPSKVRMEIRYGHDNTIFQLEKVFIDYIKTPQYIRLTQEQVNLTEDTSQIMEFPDYVCQEIINELVHLVMENTADPRLQTHIPVTQSIANPAQQQATPQQKQ